MRAFVRRKDALHESECRDRLQLCDALKCSGARIAWRAEIALACDIAVRQPRVAVGETDESIEIRFRHQCFLQTSPALVVTLR